MQSVVNCVAYRNGERLGDITLDDISEVLKQGDAFVWLGLHEPGANVIKKIEQEFGLHELAIEDTQGAHQRPKIEEYGDSLFIVMHTAQWWNDEMQRGETHIFVGRNFLITNRQGASRSYAPVRTRAEALPQRLAKGPGYALYAVMDFIVDNYFPIIDAFRGRFERLEAEIFHDRFDRNTVERLYNLKQELLDLSTAVGPVVDICNELIRIHGHLVHKELRAYYRDVLDHATRVMRDADRLQLQLSDAMQVNLALMGVRQNEVVKGLAGWGAIAAIPTVVFSMYGMNFEHMPELDLAPGYPAVVALTALGCLWVYRRLKRARWL